MKLIKSVSINAPLEKVYNNVADFHNWRLWSPWLIMDADATVTVREDGKYYDWNGKQVGSGNMTVLSETNGTHIEYDLTYLKPWKSHSKIKFELQHKGDQVIANWHMESKLPFFMFWMKKMMEVFIGMDYDRGLRMLKEVCEEGDACSRLRFDGEHHLSRIDYIGIRTECSMDDMGKKMSEDMPRLLQFVQENELEITGKPFTQYHKWAIMKNRVIYTSGIPVRKKEGISLPDGFNWGNIAETKAWAVTHIGRYHNLGNAWSAAFMYQRNKVFRVNKAIHPFEVYVNNPAETPEKELETTIYMPVR